MTPEIARTVARVAEHFAARCYDRGYGCAQSIASYKVLPVLSIGYSDLSPYIEAHQGRANAFIEDAVKAMVGRNRRTDTALR